MPRLVSVLSLLLPALACRPSEQFDLRPPKPPGLPIFAGDQLGTNRLLRMTRPEYPAALRYLGHQTIRLKLTVLEDGRVADVSYINGPDVLLPFARAALSQWRFEPAKIYSPYLGKPEAVRIITEADVKFEP